MQPRPTLRSQIDYNLAVLEQGRSLIDALEAQPQDFARQVGPHLRHVMDHYAAFLDGLPRRTVDYEARERDPRTQSEPAYARQQLQELMRRLRLLPDLLPASAPERCEPLAVVIAGGLDGEELTASQSSVLRELQFLGLHAVHHYAVLAHDLRAMGLCLPPDFGKAPGTIRHERHRAGA